MQDIHSAELQNILLSSSIEMIKKVFFSLIKQLDVEELKKIPAFVEIQNIALKNTTAQEIFGKLAIRLVQMKNISAIQFLIEDCKFNFIEMRDSNGRNLLHEACLYGAIEIAEYLLTKNFDVNAKDNRGKTSLHRAALFKENKAIIPLLKRYNANLDVRDNTDLTPLHIAAIHENSDVIGALGAAGANKKLTYKGRTYFDILKGIRNKTITAPSFLVLKKNKIFTLYSAFSTLLEPLYFFLMQKDLQTLEQLIDIVVHLANIEKNKSAEIIEIYNIAADLYIKIGAYHKAEKTASESLAIFPKEGGNKKIQAYLHYNLSTNQKNQSNIESALVNCKIAFDLINNDKDIFSRYFALLLHTKNYMQALSACEKSNCGELSDVCRIHMKYLMGELSCSDTLKEIVSDFSDSYAQISALDLQTDCYIRLRDYKKALETSKISFDLSEKQYQESREDDICNLLLKRLKTYIRCAEYHDGLIFLNTCMEKYAAEFSYNILLKYTAAVIYSANHLSDKAEALVNEIQTINPHLVILSTLYCIIAVNNIKNPDAAIQYFDLALKINPDNIHAKHLKALMFIMTKNSQQLALLLNDKNIDKEFLNYFIKKVDPSIMDFEDNIKILEESDPEIECENHDPIKIHEFCQSQKKQMLLDVSHRLSPTPEPKTKWVLSKDCVYTDDNDEMITLDPILYDWHHDIHIHQAVISSHLKLDTKESEITQTALKKGLCRHQNGIIIHNSLIKLKINGDARIYTTHIYINSDNKCLIVFDKKGNHATINKLLHENKPMEIIELKEQSEESVQLNAYKGKIFDSSSLNNNNSNSPHETPIVSQNNKSSNLI